MNTYLMFGKYSAEAIKGISAKRTVKARAAVKKCGGKVISMYALLGEYDLVLIANFPGTEQVMKASLELNKLTGISFVSEPALDVDKFDKAVGKK